jgi:hypothetical protein
LTSISNHTAILLALATELLGAVLAHASALAISETAFEFRTNRIFLPVSINEFPPVSLMLDTGAPQSRVAFEKLGLQPETKLIAGATLTLPGLKLSDQTLLAEPAGTGAYDGFLIEGLLGYDFIRRFVIDIDYVACRIRLYDPGEYRYSGTGNVVALIDLDEVKVPLIRAKIRQRGRAPIEGNFIVDTGARVSLSLNTPFVEDHKLLSYSPASIETVVGGGAGPIREARQRVSRIQSLELGRLRIDNLVVGFSQDKTGLLASRDFEGIIGGEFLQRFRVILDYSRRRMILEPNTHFADPYEFDMTGMFLVAEGKSFKTFKVLHTIENSPATEAGIRKGDMILSINGKPAARFTLDEVRGLFRRLGQAYTLTLKRGEATLRVEIKPRRLI